LLSHPKIVLVWLQAELGISYRVCGLPCVRSETMETIGHVAVKWIGVGKGRESIINVY